MRLTKKKILKILDLTKAEINCRANDGENLSLCDALSHSINKVNKVKVDEPKTSFLSVKEHFPLLSHSNAIIACKAKKVTKPKSSGLFSYWWDEKNKISRIAYINWMTEQVQKTK